MENEKFDLGSIPQKCKKLLTTFASQLKTKKFWVELFIMTAGMFVAATAVYFFLIPSKLIVGSITGLSLVLAKLLPFVSLGTMIFVINAILLLLAFVLIGNEFGAKTVYTALILGPMVDFLGKVVPMSESMFATTIVGTGQVIANPWFDLLCFVLVLSASQSILFSINASTGGLDILAKIINKYAHLSLGTSVAIGGGAICCTAFLINDVSLVIMGLIGTWINGLIVNYFMAQLSSRIRAYIISDDYEKIIDFVVHHINRGVTMHTVMGGYTRQEKMEIEVVLTKDEYSDLIDFMHKENIKSFMSSDVVSAVYGLWNKKKLLNLSSQ